MINIFMIQLFWHKVFAETVFHYFIFEIIIHALITLRLNFDIKSSLWEKFDAESSVSAKKLMSLNMSNDLSSAENTSMLNLKQMMIYMLLFSESETSEVSYFSEANIMKFLH